MGLPPHLDCTLTALPGDFYLRLPIFEPAAIIATITDPLVMIDGAEPALYPDLEILEPEEQDPGLFPIVVRTVVCVEKERLGDWFETKGFEQPTDAGLTHAANDDDIAGVLYWGSEAERSRLRRVCIGRYSRFDDLDDTSELDSYGAFRDWLLVQNNQFQAWTLFHDGWSDYNTIELQRLLPALQRYLTSCEEAWMPLSGGVGVMAPQVPVEDWLRELTEATRNQSWGVRWTLRWHLATARLERIGSERVKV
ncbi:MAG: hypothetical protein ABI743_10840 [bacterium]